MVQLNANLEKGSETLPDSSSFGWQERESSGGKVGKETIDAALD